MLDTLRTTSGGAVSFLIQCLEFIPEVVRVLVGLATFIYIMVKIVREIKIMKEK